MAKQQRLLGAVPVGGVTPLLAIGFHNLKGAKGPKDRFTTAVKEPGPAGQGLRPVLYSLGFPYRGKLLCVRHRI